MKVKTMIQCVLVAFFMMTTACKDKPQQSPSETGSGYKTMEIATSSKTFSTSYSASIKGKQDVEIRPRISGLITEIKVVEGQRVKKGQTLFVIDQVAYRATLQTAQAEVQAAQAEVDTSRLTAQSKKELYAQEVVSLYDLQTAENSLKSAEATLAQKKAELINAENNLSFTVIKSPSDGVVGTLPYRVGALVNSSITTPLTTVSDNSEMFVYFSLIENQVLSLVRRYGSLPKALEMMPEVELKLSDGSVYDRKGRIESISGVIDGNTGSVSLRAVFPNKDGMLLSGGAGSVVYPYTLENVIVIPQAATYELQDKKFVYKVVNGIAQSTEINVLAVNDGTSYVVVSGLSVGDIIVAEGAGLLRNGTPITSTK